MVAKIIENKFFELTMYAFLALGMEVVIVAIESLVGIDMYTTNGYIIHLAALSISWLFFSIILYKSAKRKYNFDALSYKGELQNEKLLPIILISLLIICLSSYVNGGVKIMSEYREIMIYYNQGLIVFAFNLLTYLGKGCVIVLLIAFGQKLGEDISSNLRVPYGGGILACAWGIINIITGSLYSGLYTFIVALGFGMIYILLRKNLRLVYPLIFILLIL